MSKTILITGATDGIGLLTAKTLAAEGHKLLLHGRSADKLAAVAAQLGGAVAQFRADLSRLTEVRAMAAEIRAQVDVLDVLINNAGVLRTAQTRTPEGLDIRFVVNTLAPYVLTQHLLPILPAEGRVVNLSSAAQARVDLVALRGESRLDDMATYAQSKLAITIWTQDMARAHPDGPAFIAVNPGSLLASKMVREGFGIAGNDLGIGADILRKAALSPGFAKASGRYFDNDSGQFAAPHAAAADPDHVAAVMKTIRALIAAGETA
ncbi:SDR family NAD(P)-dependent oxidoreductase [Pseudorhodobacter sp. E13]|uniref:SDR family NAD(P)-dependent oxidoreductase n=1 Tax=Pseudorhodobacter sp. E13 TaxID=2487931 RepID=UPI000F8EE8F8|nr:SDR family NAD(P)-dependent oxidoreductase [Pseudorhodobacter sp. E13]RUS59234.1 SDR family NAD(P)-dependent oxidoreductase [Pseudorhodobacter sp. E13]